MRQSAERLLKIFVPFFSMFPFSIIVEFPFYFFKFLYVRIDGKIYEVEKVHGYDEMSLFVPFSILCIYMCSNNASSPALLNFYRCTWLWRFSSMRLEEINSLEFCIEYFIIYRWNILFSTFFNYFIHIKKKNNNITDLLIVICKMWKRVHENPYTYLNCDKKYMPGVNFMR